MSALILPKTIRPCPAFLRIIANFNLPEENLFVENSSALCYTTAVLLKKILNNQ
jgi:hypothetical protein